jgi:asparagine synthase (glutamine-hydrolysing)
MLAVCGIAGSLDLRDVRDDEEIVARMTDVLSHRGPDDAGLLVDPPVTLGHRRLSILDLSAAGHQPMASPDRRFWITFNGEIYNYVELAAELRTLGYRFRTTCDTEVLLAAYEHWGPGALRRLNGMFAFAIWDRHRRELFCARDRFGVKPFYYTTVDGRFRFASEIKALLLDPAVPRHPNVPRLLDFLAYGITDHTVDTLFEGIFQLPPGGNFVVRLRDGAPSADRWYVPQPLERADETPAQELRSRLVEAVRLRLRSDVPVGTTLSGGLDSSAVTAIAAMLRRADSLEPAATFSARATNPDLDEGHYMQPVLDRTGAPNYAFTPQERDLVDHLDHVLWHQDEPFHSASVYAHWRLAELARSQVTVLLDGSGGDEALAGYEYLLYPGLLFTLVSHGRLASALSEARHRRRVQGAPLLQSVKELVKVKLPARLRAPDSPDWLGPLFGDISPPPLPGPTLLDHHVYGLAVQPLPMYNHHVDRNTMSLALEARNPFLDYRVVELGLALRPEEHVHRGFTKWTLRESLRDLLPATVVDRPRKQGFTTDEREWMRGGLGEIMLETLTSARARDRGYLETARIGTLLREHMAGGDHGVHLWRAFIAERWHNLFIDPTELSTPVRGRSGPATAHRAADAVVRLIGDAADVTVVKNPPLPDAAR